MPLIDARLLAVHPRVRLPARRRSWLAISVALSLCGLLIISYSVRLLSPPARLIDIGAPGDAYVATSFYQPEQAGDTSFRWSGPHSALALPVSTGDLILSARLHGAADGQRLALLTADAPISLQPLTGDWRTYHVLFTSGATSPIHLYADLVRPGENDPRELGVALDWVRLTPVGDPQAGAAQALGEAAKLVWALALLGAAIWIIGGALTPAPAHLALAVPALMSPLVAGLLVWIWRDLGSLRWLLPLSAGPLLLATVAVGTLWAFAHVPSLRHGGQRLLRPGPLVRLGIVAAPALVLLWPAAPMAVRGAAALALLWMPGWLIVRHLLPHERDPALGLVLRLCGATAFHCILLLWLAPVLAAGGAPLVTSICLLVSAGCVLLLPRSALRSLPRGLVRSGGSSPVIFNREGREEHEGRTASESLDAARRLATRALRALAAARRLATRGLPGGEFGRAVLGGGRELAAWGLVLLVAVALRLPHLGAAEFHDDEASVALAAAAFAQGDPEVLLTQLKGPAQILLPAGPLLLTGQLSELTARLPFALAGLAVVVGGMALARRLVGRGLAPLVAGLVLALDGLLIAFARIVQYQSLVLLLSLGAYWCCWRFARGAPGAWRHLSLAALFSAVALLGHWDAIYVLPALLWLVVVGVRRRRWGLARTARALAGPVFLGAALLASFYVPFVRHPHASETLGHLGERTGQGGGWRLVNNLGANYDLMTVYSTPAQVWTVALLISGLVVAVGCAAAGRRWLIGGLGPAALARPTAAGIRPLLLWFGAGWLAMTFLIAEPRTHLYVVVVPGALLAAAAAQRLTRLPLKLPLLRSGLLAGALLALAWAGLHQYTIFVRQSPEYIRTYPAARLLAGPGTPATLPLAAAARFGFPNRDGWKAIGELYRRGELQGALASNQSSEVVAWYLRGQRRCGAEPSVYAIALAAPNPAIPPGYVRTITVQIDGRDQLALYQRPGTFTGGPRRIALQPFLVPFDERRIPTLAVGAAGCSGPSTPITSNQEQTP